MPRASRATQLGFENEAVVPIPSAKSAELDPAKVVTVWPVDAAADTIGCSVGGIEDDGEAVDMKIGIDVGALVG